MIFRNENLSFKEACIKANEIDIVDYLDSLGYQPAKPPKGNSYWYLSMLPERFEGSPSFKVNRNKNVWYDFGLDMKKKEGTLIDFCMRYYGDTLQDAVERLSGPVTVGQILPRYNSSIEKKPVYSIIILGDKPIQSLALINYLHTRRIPLDVAQKYCREVDYQYKDYKFYSLGFKHDGGGYELRNANFKNSSSPKGPTFIDNGADTVTSFEGFFNFLSFVTIHQNQDLPPTNYLILNGTAFAEMSLPVLDKHRVKHLYWDRGKGGRMITQMAQKHDPSYIDKSDLYKGYDDLNEWHCKIGTMSSRKALVLAEKIFGENTLDSQDQVNKKVTPSLAETIANPAPRLGASSDTLTFKPGEKRWNQNPVGHDNPDVNQINQSVLEPRPKYLAESNLNTGSNKPRDRLLKITSSFVHQKTPSSSKHKNLSP